MKEKFWDSAIDRNTPWDGNESTNNLPVKGSRVEEFIKSEFDTKFGYSRIVSGEEQYFANEDSAALYDIDPNTYSYLLLNSILLPSGGGSGSDYTALINLTTPQYNAVKLGSYGNSINFSVDIKNSQGQSTGELVDVIIGVSHNASTQTQRQSIVAGRHTSLELDNYLKEGTNTVNIRIIGKTSGSSTMVAVIYEVVNLGLEDFYEAANFIDMREGEATIQIPYSIYGYGTKKLEWYIDGELVPFNKDEDEVVESETTRTKYITLNQLNQGRHTLQFRASTLVNGETFYTDTIYHDLLVFTGDRSSSMVGISMIVPSEVGIIDGTAPILYGLEQFVPYEFRFFSYSPRGLVLDTQVKVDDEVIGSVTSSNGIPCTVTYTPMSSGEKSVVFELSDGITYTISAVVNGTSLNLSEITDGLDLYFSGDGKNNLSANKDVWSYGDYTGTFTGFAWTERSGWKGNRLVISEGCSFSIDAKPLDKDATETGKTIEFEFKTTNVNNDNAILLDMRDTNGAGILITATKVSITSSAGVTLETEYKENELVRVGFVINKSKNVTRKGLTLIYCNGISSRSINRGTSDTYEVDKNITFTGSTGATIELKSIMVYNNALNDDQMLNNYNLYRDTLDEMLSVYNKNDIYYDGTYTISPEKTSKRLPYMLITGDIPVLENTTDKNEQITVDIEYVNVQEPELNFTMEGAAMRPQGTSSMGYPKKNFRIYTQKLPNTVLKNYLGNVVANKLYAFRKGAQPVDCWCLKADYAESSGTHNTAIARLWGNALKNVNIEVDGKKEYVCMTNAQKAAAANNYPYDVRTTIDGFPILLFYRKSKQDTPIFLGKYNFNNDKSTENVFGFTGIPGFDNSRMQCWEILNNGNSLALFTESETFDSGWKEAFESRYPDTKTPNTSDLKAFCQWMSSVTQEDFVTQKHQHFNLWMMAAYYCYLMRHAAADQFVKNAMLTSEDGEHFYFILYDNDTINGLINTGHLKIKPTDDRNSIGEDGSYLFAGHDSRLWNMLESDEEFMLMVSQIDNALYTAGISYRNAVKEFDEGQAEKWCERIYNQDAQYKYIGPYTYDSVNNLFMMQGSRALHRRWFLAKRFGIYDAKFVSGTYKSQSIEIKCINDTIPGQKFSIKSGYPLHYGYGINNVPREFGIYLDKGESYDFVTTEKLNLGDPLRIYAAHNLEEIDFSAMSDRLAVVNIAGVYDEDLGTKLKSLTLGNAVKENVSVTDISGIKKAEKLERLDIRNMKGLTSIDLSGCPLLKYVDARGSNISSIAFAEGSILETLQIPSTMQVLELTQMYNLSNITSENNFMTLKSMVIKDCPYLTRDFSLVRNWRVNTQVGAENLSLDMTGVLWYDVDPEALISLGDLDSLSLKGKIHITAATEEQIDAITSIFGATCFEPGGELQISAPDGLFIGGGSEVRSGHSIELSAAIFSDNPGTVTWSITSGSSYASIQNSSGTTCLIKTTEQTTDREITIQAKHVPTEGDITYATKTIKLTKVTRVTGGSVNGPATIGGTGEYIFTPSPTNYDEPYTVTWSLTGDAATNGYVSISNQNNESCQVQVVERVFNATFNIVATVNNGKSTFTKSKSVSIGVKFVLNILSNQGEDEAIAAVKATVKYGSSSTTMSNGDELNTSPGTSITITFPSVSGYKAPENMELVLGSDDVVKTATYLAEQVEVRLSSHDGGSLNGAVVNIGGTDYTWSGTPIIARIAFDKEYTIQFRWVVGYLSPLKITNKASQVTRIIEVLYEIMPDDIVIFDQTISDPETMISGGINSSVIQEIRSNSHRYLGKNTAEGQMTLCQLDDNDSTRYCDGTTADLKGSEGDVFMKMPEFWYRSYELDTDIWGIRFKTIAPQEDGWNHWDTNALIGVFEASNSNNKLCSISRKTPASSSTRPSHGRGVGFQLVDWQMHCVMALLYYAQYGHTNCQLKIGNNGKHNYQTGSSESCGMNDTKGTSPVPGLNDNGVEGNSIFVNFWGLENWWGNMCEYLRNVSISYHSSVSSNSFTITELDGTGIGRSFEVESKSSWIAKFKFGNYCDMVPIINTNYTSSVGYCDYFFGYNTGYAYRGVESSAASYLGISSLGAYSSTSSTLGTRLAFRGQCTIIDNVEEFKNLTVID